MPTKSITETFSYSPAYIIDKNNTVIKVFDRATLKIIIGSKKTHRVSSIPLECLIDSGSDMNLFPASWGESIGLKVKKGEPSPVIGIGAVQIESWLHDEIIIHIGKKIEITTSVQFSYQQQVPLLGMNGFFDKFARVIFDDEKKQLALVKA